jgi:hypothetical protein
MGILNIARAERAGAHLLIQLYGPPRSGKTYTALRIARGMVGPKGRIGMLDTESGRARLYSDKVPGGFVVGELTPPRGLASASGKLGTGRSGFNQIKAAGPDPNRKSCARRPRVQPCQGRVRKTRAAVMQRWCGRDAAARVSPEPARVSYAR